MALPRSLAFVLVLVATTKGQETCKQGSNCHLPDCFCPTLDHPLGAKIIPQIVYFGFDDAVNPSVSRYYDKLFKPSRLNPNGCPITLSLYVSDKYTDYAMVNSYFHKNFEIADHSVTHTFIKTAKKLNKEASDQKWNLEMLGGIPDNDVVGWRSPDLATAGDAQPHILKKLGFTYDISLPYINRDEPLTSVWPFTLDFGYPYSCSVPPCPGKNVSHAGFWEVPINTHYHNSIPCPYIDACRPDTEEDAYNFLMANFNNTYKHSKAPFGLSMHAAWFYSNKYFRAMDRFICTILGYHDVYIVNVKQMLAWMRTPHTIYESKTFEPWQCPGQNADHSRPERDPCIPAEVESSEGLPLPYTEQEEVDEVKSSLNPLMKWILHHKRSSMSSPRSFKKKVGLEGSMVFRAIMN